MNTRWKMLTFLRNNGLSIVLSFLFLGTWAGLALVGWHHENEKRRLHGETKQPFKEYLVSFEFGEATFENWESEFFQMGLYVILTAYLYQKGSSESKDPDRTEGVDRRPNAGMFGVPAPVRKGGWIKGLYSHSLSIAFFLLFMGALIGHWVTGANTYNAELRQLGHNPIPVYSYITTSRFWFESLQNWQSEFLAVLSIVVLSIWLRERGSPESKPVDAAHSSTGN